jgi:antitoxin component YwqK of YwqJK toxin-antitoxin module
MTEQVNQRDTQGKPHGIWKYYYLDGTLWWKAHWHHGKVDRLQESYWTNGTPHLKEYHLNIK